MRDVPQCLESDHPQALAPDSRLPTPLHVTVSVGSDVRFPEGKLLGVLPSSRFKSDAPADMSPFDTWSVPRSDKREGRDYRRGRPIRRRDSKNRIMETENGELKPLDSREGQSEVT